MDISKQKKPKRLLAKLPTRLIRNLKRELTDIRLVQFMKVNGKVGLDMAKEKCSGLMALYTMGLGNTIKHAVAAVSIT